MRNGLCRLFSFRLWDVYFVGLRAGPLEIADGLAKPAADFGEFLGTENKHYYNEN